MGSFCHRTGPRHASCQTSSLQTLLNHLLTNIASRGSLPCARQFFHLSFFGRQNRLYWIGRLMGLKSPASGTRPHQKQFARSRPRSSHSSESLRANREQPRDLWENEKEAKEPRSGRSKVSLRCA